MHILDRTLTLQVNTAGETACTLLFQGEPYWYGEGGASFAWNWQDLLQFLITNWSALMLEEALPIPLSSLEHPGELWVEARKRWEDMAIGQMMQEEKALYSFWHRHNLAMGMPGAGLPALIWMRSGNTVWLVQSKNHPVRLDFQAARHDLEHMGDLLSACFEKQPASQTRSLVESWKNRDSLLCTEYIRYRCPLPPGQMKILESRFGPQPIPADPYDDEPVFFAAARMARHHLTIDTIASLWNRLHQVEPLLPGSALQNLSAKSMTFFNTCKNMRAYEQGYALARWLRTEMNVPEGIFDVESLLRQIEVTIEGFHFGSEAIDAIACWGSIQPLILLNGDPESRAKTPHGRRSTLAHELCHLLIDRDAAFPVAEVLGGEVDVVAERRANAFAAELLLPQIDVKTVYSASADMGQCLSELCHRNGVGKQLAAWQILNSGIPLSEDEIIRLRQIGEGNSALDHSG